MPRSGGIMSGDGADRMAPMVTGVVTCVLDTLGVRRGRVAVLKDVPAGNGNWLVEMPGGQRAVLRRYHRGADPEELAYEHAVLGHLAGAGWAVPRPVGELICQDGLWYCLTRYVPGKPVVRESPARQRRRGCDLARLHLALRDLSARIGQRRGWRPQHSAHTVSDGVDLHACVQGLMAVSPQLGSWAQPPPGRRAPPWQPSRRCTARSVLAWPRGNSAKASRRAILTWPRSNASYPGQAPRHRDISLADWCGALVVGRACGKLAELAADDGLAAVDESTDVAHRGLDHPVAADHPAWCVDRA